MSDIRNAILEFCKTVELQRDFGLHLAHLMGQQGVSVDSYMLRFQCAVVSEELLRRALVLTIPSLQAQS